MIGETKLSVLKNIYEFKKYLGNFNYRTVSEFTERHSLVFNFIKKRYINAYIFIYMNIDIVKIDYNI